jgi:hypothetical protein
MVPGWLNASARLLSLLIHPHKSKGRYEDIVLLSTLQQARRLLDRKDDKEDG